MADVTGAVRLVNLTPHALVFYGPEVASPVPPDARALLVLPPARVAARVGLAEVAGEELAVAGTRLRIRSTVVADPPVLPAADGQTLLVVSMPVYQARPDREDLLVVDDAVRDRAGRVVGARGLARPAHPGRQTPRSLGHDCPAVSCTNCTGTGRSTSKVQSAS